MYRRFTHALAGLVGLSRAKAPAAVPVRWPAPGALAPATVAAAVAGKQLLLLDDEEAILLPTAKYFRGLGWTVEVAREAEEGEALISHRHYDLAILDVRVSRYGGAGGL